MLTRIIVGLIGVPILIFIVFFAPFWATGLVISLVSSLAAYELLRCTSKTAPKRFAFYACLSAFLIPINYAQSFFNFRLETLVFVASFLAFLELMLSFKNKEQIKFEAVSFLLFAGIIMPLLLSSLVRLGQNENSAFYMFLPFVAAFSSDTGGYFFGKFLGKKKAFPHLSPNKTYAGCIGGMVSSLVCMLGYGFVISRFNIEVNYVFMAIYGIFGSFACQCGDLAFSAIKREFGIKDYGKLIPGHGGALDRFDSLHFTAPMIEILVLIIPSL